MSFVTPVYNGGPFLAQAIDSVLEQEYENFEYVIVNNCSTDETLSVALHYARLDERIRVLNNEEFLDCEQNHNAAFRQVSPLSQYCKVISADDRLLPGALNKLLQVALRYPSVGIVGSYQLSQGDISWQGLPKTIEVLSGREICRLGLLHGVYVFGNPMSLLYRSDLLRRSGDFFPHSKPHADASACYANLHNCDFGFVHEVLSIERNHEFQVSSGLQELEAGWVIFLDMLARYGPIYLSEAEYAMQWEKSLNEYYRMLGGQALRGKGVAFWRYHRQELAELGHELKATLIMRGALQRIGGRLRRLTQTGTEPTG